MPHHNDNFTQTRRVAVGLLSITLLAGFDAARAASLSYIGQQIVPTGTLFNGTTVGGLSGIDRDPATGRYIAISDDRSSFQPARFYSLDLDLAQFQRSAAPGMAGVAFQGVTTIQQPDGTAFPTNGVDPEGIRFNPRTGTLVWSNEGQRTPSFQDPTVREMRLDGSHVRGFGVPAAYLPTASSGIRNNLAFESLTLSTDGRTLYTATENALLQDGPAAAVGVTSDARVLSFDVASGVAGAQYVYRTEAVALPPAVPGAFATNGLVELLAVAPGRFIAVERSFAIGAATPGVGPNGLPTGNTIRLYLASTDGATDVSGLASLAGQAVVPMSKTLLLDLSTLQQDDGSALATDNIEGISWGPMLNGQQTLMLVSDNNFGATQFTQFIALAVTAPIPESGTALMLLAGLLLLPLHTRLARRAP